MAVAAVAAALPALAKIAAAVSTILQVADTAAGVYDTYYGPKEDLDVDELVEAFESSDSGKGKGKGKDKKKKGKDKDKKEKSDLAKLSEAAGKISKTIPKVGEAGAELVELFQGSGSQQGTSASSNKSGSSKGKKQQSHTQDVDVNKLLEQVLEAKKTQQLSQLPNTPDVPKLTLNSGKVYTFLRSTYWGDITSSFAEEMDAIYFSLDTLPNFLEFTHLFEQWKVLQVTIKFEPTGSGEVQHLTFPLETIVDYTDDLIPTSLDELKQYATHRSHPAGVYAERVVAPKMRVPAIRGSGSDGYSLSDAWCSTDIPSIRWHGLKWGLAPAIGPVGIIYNVKIDYVLSMKGTK